MRIFSKKAFQFDHPTGDQPSVQVRALDFATVPDWVADAAMYKWASQDGDVELIENKADEIAAETGKSKSAKKPDDAQ